MGEGVPRIRPEFLAQAEEKEKYAQEAEGLRKSLSQLEDALIADLKEIDPEEAKNLDAQRGGEPMSKAVVEGLPEKYKVGEDDILKATSLEDLKRRIEAGRRITAKVKEWRSQKVYLDVALGALREM